MSYRALRELLNSGNDVRAASSWWLAGSTGHSDEARQSDRRGQNSGGDGRHHVGVSDSNVARRRKRMLRRRRRRSECQASRPVATNLHLLQIEVI